MTELYFGDIIHVHTVYVYTLNYINIYNICTVPVAVLNKQNGLSIGKSEDIASCTAGFLD